MRRKQIDKWAIRIAVLMWFAFVAFIAQADTFWTNMAKSGFSPRMGLLLFVSAMGVWAITITDRD